MTPPPTENLNSSKLPLKYLTFTFGEIRFTFGKVRFTRGDSRRFFKVFINFFGCWRVSGTLWVGGGACRGFREERQVLRIIQENRLAGGSWSTVGPLASALQEAPRPKPCTPQIPRQKAPPGKEDSTPRAQTSHARSSPQNDTRKIHSKIHDNWRSKFLYRYRPEGIFSNFFRPDSGPPPPVHMLLQRKKANSFVPAIFFPIAWPF